MRSFVQLTLSYKPLLVIVICFLLVNDTAKATIRYVKPGTSGSGTGSSWANASSDLQLMINNSVSGDEIWIAQGTYKPVRRADALTVITTGNRNNAFVLKTGVTIYGGFTGVEIAVRDRNYTTHPVILSGDIGTSASTDNCYHVVISPGNTSATATILDGCTVSNGYSVGNTVKLTLVVSGFSIDINQGAGIYIIRSSLVIRNCGFSRNAACANGGGMYDTLSSAPVLTNCKFSENNAGLNGGGMYHINAAPGITSCLFELNTAISGAAIYNNNALATISNTAFSNNHSTLDGGALCNYNGSAVFTNCTFTSNTCGRSGGATYNNASGAIFDKCSFILNTAVYGGAFEFRGDITASIENSFIQGNTATFSGGAGTIQSDSVLITNCLISGNKARLKTLLVHGDALLANATVCGNYCSEGPGIIDDQSHKIRIVNCIIAGNMRDSVISNSIIAPGFNEPNITYSDVESLVLYPGVGNILANPLFIRPVSALLAPTTAGDYRLQQFSPSINAGYIPMIPAGITTDIIGNPRIFQGNVDMGAYEMLYAPPVTSIRNSEQIKFN